MNKPRTGLPPILILQAKGIHQKPQDLQKTLREKMDNARIHVRVISDDIVCVDKLTWPNYNNFGRLMHDLRMKPGQDEIYLTWEDYKSEVLGLCMMEGERAMQKRIFDIMTKLATYLPDGDERRKCMFLSCYYAHFVNCELPCVSLKETYSQERGAEFYKLDEAIMNMLVAAHSVTDETTFETIIESVARQEDRKLSGPEEVLSYMVADAELAWGIPISNDISSKLTITRKAALKR